MSKRRVVVTGLGAVTPIGNTVEAVSYTHLGGRLVFHPDDIRLFTDLLLELYDLSASSEYIRDMRINKKLTTDEIGNAVGMGK